MKKALAGTVVAAAIALSALAVAPESTSAANDYCGKSANGCEHSQANTKCAGHGAFGAFGKDNSLAGGADGDNTAYNNSTLCGNPQGAAGEVTP